jgi:hypothetical protein
MLSLEDLEEDFGCRAIYGWYPRIIIQEKAYFHSLT